jgi:hypothetical protein
MLVVTICEGHPAVLDAFLDAWEKSGASNCVRWICVFNAERSLHTEAPRGLKIEVPPLPF